MEYKTVTFSGLTNTSYVLEKFNQKDTASGDMDLCCAMVRPFAMVLYILDPEVMPK